MCYISIISNLSLRREFIFFMKTKNTNKSNILGFSLVEVMISLSILGILAAGISSAMLHARRLAESNIYESTALTVAIGFLEQIKNIDYDTVLSSINDPAGTPLLTKINLGDDQALFLNVENSIPNIVINVDANGNPTRQMQMWVTPEINDLEPLAANIKVLETKLTFKWKSLETDKNRTDIVRFVRSYVETF